MKSYPKIVVRLALVLTALAINLSFARQAKAASFYVTGTLTGARAGHTATLLPNGKVLVLGGYDGHGPNRLASAELYDPASGTWTNANPLTIGRTRPTTTLLSNRLVLVAAGHDTDTSSTATCELYDPTWGTWMRTGAMTAARGWHTATLLLNGKVLVAAGYNRGGGSDLSTAELYDPDTGTWSLTGSLASARDNHTATLLFDGRVLVAGGAPDGGASGSSLSSAELFDPAAGTWQATGSMISARQYHTATLLPDGRVLVIGGDSNGNAVSAAELYDPATGTWKAAGVPRSARTLHTATLLPDGKVLVVGGLTRVDASVALSSAEVYDPATGTWATTGPLSAARGDHSATLLPNGNVLIAAGYDPATSLWVSSAERYDSALGPMMLLNPIKRPRGGFQFVFTSAPVGAYSVLAAKDLALPLVYLDEGVLNWTVLLPVPEFSPGLYFFGDPEATNSPQRFYQVVAGLPCQGPNPCPCAYHCVYGIWSHYATCRDCFYEP